MKTKAPLILYSTCTWLAYAIAQSYYKETHYVWCSPYFSAEQPSPAETSMPPSSTPLDIYNSLREEVVRGDRHSASIAMNKAGIVAGAHFKAREKIISRKEQAEILAVVQQAELRDFSPLIFVIPYGSVSDITEEVPVHERAHPLSIEFRIRRLPRKCFHAIKFHTR